MFLKIKKFVGVGAAAIFIVAWFSYGILQNTYVNYSRSPDAESGRTVPYAVKGIVIYITHDQQGLLSWLEWIEVGSGMITALVILIHRGDPFRSKE
jgi:hypothetical protein